MGAVPTGSITTKYTIEAVIKFSIKYSITLLTVVVSVLEDRRIQLVILGEHLRGYSSKNYTDNMKKEGLMWQKRNNAMVMTGSGKNGS
jgi:hypothetical protein